MPVVPIAGGQVWKALGLGSETQTVTLTQQTSGLATANFFFRFLPPPITDDDVYDPTYLTHTFSGVVNTPPATEDALFVLTSTNLVYHRRPPTTGFIQNTHASFHLVIGAPHRNQTDEAAVLPEGFDINFNPIPYYFDQWVGDKVLPDEFDNIRRYDVSFNPVSQGVLAPGAPFRGPILWTLSYECRTVANPIACRLWFNFAQVTR